MAIPLEHMGDGSTADRNFQKLMGLVADFGGQSVGVRFGETTATFSAATTSTNVAVSHGLGRTPAIVWTQAHDTGSTNLTPTGNLFSVGASTFNVIFVNATAQTKTNMPFYWAVIG